MSQAKIQVQDVTGNWINVGSTLNQPQLIFRSLETYAKTYKRLIRAVDTDGNILQIRE